MGFSGPGAIAILVYSRAEFMLCSLQTRSARRDAYGSWDGAEVRSETAADSLRRGGAADAHIRPARRRLGLAANMARPRRMIASLQAAALHSWAQDPLALQAPAANGSTGSEMAPQTLEKPRMGPEVARASSAWTKVIQATRRGGGPGAARSPHGRRHTRRAFSPSRRSRLEMEWRRKLLKRLSLRPKMARASNARSPAIRVARLGVGRGAVGPGPPARDGGTNVFSLLLEPERGPRTANGAANP